MSAASINNVTGKRFIELLSVDSTNNYAMQRVQNGDAEHGDAYFAYEQTAGKGQPGKQWFSGKGENIILSVVLDTNGLFIRQQFILNMLAALSVKELFNNYSTEIFKIKWPNDVYQHDRKAAGILIENIIRGEKWQYAVAGFGININQTTFSDDLKNPVSLKSITGKNYDALALAKELCLIFCENFKRLHQKNDKQILKDYNAVLYKKDEVVKLKQGAVVFSGLIKAVDEYGKLLVNTTIENSFESGSIEWLL